MLPTSQYLPTLPSLLESASKALIHRDLSWLQFNERVLQEARDLGNPIVERLKFLAITSSNLDEFFMIRVSSHFRAKDSKPEFTAALLEKILEFTARQQETFDLLQEELLGLKVVLVERSQPGGLDYTLGQFIFETQYLPHLSVIEAFHPSMVAGMDNLQSAVFFEDGRWIKIPKSLPLVTCEKSQDTIYVFMMDELLMTYLKSHHLIPKGIIRVTRDGDFTVDLEQEDPESIPDLVKTYLGRREKGKPIRLQYRGGFTDDELSKIAVGLRLKSNQVFSSSGSLYLQSLMSSLGPISEFLIKQGAGVSAHVPIRIKATLPKQLEDITKVFNYLDKNDILLHHPYDSFEGYVQFLRAAASDPLVESITQTVYRVDQLSPVIETLKLAAKTKKVTVVIELRARFDELNNLHLSTELGEAGVEVKYGFGKLKLHAKIALVTRKAVVDGQEQIKTYTHLSTGNYNSATARVYTDLAILTANPDIGKDAQIFFESVFKEQLPTGFKTLVAAPSRLHRKLIQLIQYEAEAAKNNIPSRIVAKVNALIDHEVIKRLYEASQAGVQIDLIVRGACSLIPGITGVSENIRVISLVDRFLEHSRLYYFGYSKKLYLSSADWMPRNFFSRLEIAFPILDPILFEYIEKVLIPIYLSDVKKARELTSLGTWKRRTSKIHSSNLNPELKKSLGVNAGRSQQAFETLAQTGYAHTGLDIQTLVDYGDVLTPILSERHQKP